jgi:hypothetical protein
MFPGITQKRLVTLSSQENLSSEVRLRSLITSKLKLIKLYYLAGFAFLGLAAVVFSALGAFGLAGAFLAALTVS